MRRRGIFRGVTADGKASHAALLAPGLTLLDYCRARSCNKALPPRFRRAGDRLSRHYLPAARTPGAPRRGSTSRGFRTAKRRSRREEGGRIAHASALRQSRRARRRAARARRVSAYPRRIVRAVAGRPCRDSGLVAAAGARLLPPRRLWREADRAALRALARR